MSGRTTAAGTAVGTAAGAWLVSAAFAVFYILLELLTALPGTPAEAGSWRPSQALTLALMMVQGPRMAGLVFVAMVLAELATHGGGDMLAGALSAAAAAGGYAVAAKVLREEVDFDARLSRLRDVLLLVVMVVAAAMAVTALQIAIRTAAGALEWEFYTAAAFRAWAADVIGILALGPALLLHRSALANPRRWLTLISLESVIVALVVAAETWLLFGPMLKDAFKGFYLLFLPLIWIGVRHGMPGATLAVVATQICLHGAMLATDGTVVAITDLQLLMLALTVTNLVLGAVVSERRSAELWLRAHQAALAHASRLSATGEMASTLAHELNQPLAATIAYIRACQVALRRGPADPEMLELMDKAVAQADRASQVVRGLRAFLRKDEVPRAPAEPRTLIAEALALAGPEAAQHQVALRAQVEDGLPRVVVDAIQIQQVVLNLVRNAIEAAAAEPAARRRVRILARHAGDGVQMSVIDQGPGLAPEISEKLFTPFNTTKPTGMGLGLAIARSIVEAHGGRLWAEPGQPRGTVFRFTLPIPKEDRG